MIYTRTEAAKILELFEDILDEHDISIPNEDRTGDDSEAALYGMTYWNLLYDVEERLTTLLDRADHEAVITQEFEP